MSQPVSLDNERAALNMVIDTCEQALKNFQDAEELSQKLLAAGTADPGK